MTSCAFPIRPLMTAARRFARVLATEALLEHTARVETTLYAPVAYDGAPEQALIKGLAGQAPFDPRRDLVWTDDADGQEPVQARLRAYDKDGRLLLGRTYRTTPAQRRAEPGVAGV